MNRGKKQFFICFALRTVILGVLIACLSLAQGSVVEGKAIIVLLNCMIFTAYYLTLWLMSTVRIGVKIGALFVKKGAFYAKIDSLGSIPALVIAVIAVYELLFTDASVFSAAPGAVNILLTVVIPALVLVDWLFFAPHEKRRFASALVVLVYIPATAFICLRPSGYGWYAFAFLSAALFFALTVGLYFIGTKLPWGKNKKIPYPLLWHDMPVDISSAFGKKEIAGSHGFLTVKGENFVFEDGTPVKFWGVNFNSVQNFPEHSHSEKVARRLARAGVNMVRFHQLDAEWAAPNIFAFKKGKRLDSTRSFDEESLDRLDYLVYCLKNEGIYIYLDFLTYRRFRVGDGVINAEKLPEAAKPYCAFDRTLIDLQKEYNRNLLTHVNKYTGVAYKDEPAIALSEVVNECDLLDAEYTKITLEPYRTQLLERYRAYAAEQGVKNPNEDIDGRKDPFMRKFLLETQKAYAREIIDDIRAIGGRFPMTAMNRESDRTVVLTNGITDFSDSHAYWRGGNQNGFMNDPMSMQETNGITRQLVTNAIDGKPFFVSEWDAPWPNEFRADVTLWTAAVGALQNWSGFTLHTYRYGTAEQDYITEKLGRSIALGGSYSRGLFDCYNDPAKMGLFYHAALIFRRGDVSSAKETEVYSMPEEEYLSCKDERHLKKVYSPRIEEWKKLRFSVGKKRINKLEGAPQNVVSDTRELRREPKKGRGVVDSARTQVAYGFCRGKNTLGSVVMDVKSDFATIAVSSLNDRVISETDTMLLTAVGRADNTDCGYNFLHTALTKEGKAPILADVIEAKIEIRTKYPDLKVWAVNNEGSLIGQLKTSYDGEKLSFTIGKKFESIYYLIQRQ